MIRPILIATAMSGALPALAAAAVFDCTFDRECFEQDGCTDTDWSYSAEFDAESGGTGTIVTDAETVVIFAFEGPEAAYWHLQGLGPSGAHLATITSDGSARHVTHVPDGPLAITYFGQCEVR